MTSALISPALISTVETPIGPFTVVAADTDDSTVLASGWTADIAELLVAISPSLRPILTKRVGHIEGITDAVLAYHEGDFDGIRTVAVQQNSGVFRQHAWQILRAVPAGQPVSYTELAALSGRPPAIRAAASACARNAAALFVPCHRVLRSDGGLGGFRWGIPAKRWLLAHESADDRGRTTSPRR